MVSLRSQTMEIKDARELPFCQVDNALIRSSKLDPFAKLVYVALCGYANIYTVDCFPSIKRICTDLGVSKPTVLKAIKALCDNGVLEVEERHDDLGRNKSHRYTIKDWRAEEPARVNDVDTRVSQIDTGGKGRLPGRVNDVDTKEKERERETIKDNQGSSLLSQTAPPEKKVFKPKPKREPNSQIQLVTYGIDEAYGEKYPEWPKHVTAINKLLGLNYSPTEIVGCWTALYKNGDGRFPPLSWVVDRIKAYRQNGGKMPERSQPSGNHKKYPGPNRDANPEEYYRSSLELTRK